MTIKHNADTFSALVDHHLAAAKTHLGALRGLPGDAAAEEVARTFDAIGLEVGAVTGLAEILSAVHPDEGVRTAAENAIQRMCAFSTELSLDRSAFEPFSRLDLSQPMASDVKRFVEHTLRDYRRGGVDKDDETRERIRSLQEKLVQTGQEFDRNIMTGGKPFRLAAGHADLAGLPQDYLDAHPEDPDGSVTLSTDPTDFLPVLLYAERDETRRAFFMVYHTRAYPENEPVLKRLLAERHELAQALGFEHWAHFSCEDKMIGSAEAARDFAMKVTALAAPVAQAEYDELLEEQRSLDPGAEKVRPWQSRFLMERIKREKYSFDSQSVRPYFAYESVKEGILATTEALFGVEIRPASDDQGDVHFWHESVETFDVFENGKRTARFYLDMFPRESKFKHAAMFQLYAGLEGENAQLPEAALVCNFPEPKDGDPALLLHDQVTTFFHEFGHLLHHLFAVSPFYGFAGIACEWDFVEVPSQLYEEWAWSASVLQKFARHHETGEPIPTLLVDRLRAAEEYGKGLGVNGQMLYALYSLTLYDRDPAGIEPGDVMGDMQSELTLYEKVPGTAMHTAFGHLHGYSANYYTYMWSLVISKDFFGQFEGDLMDTVTARRYRDEVLAQGGSEDASEMVKSFLGREAGFTAWETWLRA